MLKLQPLDPNVPIFQQLGADVSPAVLVNVFHPEFRNALDRYPTTAVASPHLFTRLTVPNLCVRP